MFVKIVVRPICSATRRICDFVLGAWKCGQTPCSQFDASSQWKLKLGGKWRNEIVKSFLIKIRHRHCFLFQLGELVMTLRTSCNVTSDGILRPFTLISELTFNFLLL